LNPEIFLGFFSFVHMTLNKELLELAIKEDIGDGDHSSLSCIPADAQGKARLLIKEDGILAGIDVAVEVFKRR